jgi:hypothetical protein
MPTSIFELTESPFQPTWHRDKGRLLAPQFLSLLDLVKYFRPLLLSMVSYSYGTLQTEADAFKVIAKLAQQIGKDGPEYAAYTLPDKALSPLREGVAEIERDCASLGLVASAASCSRLKVLLEDEHANREKILALCGELDGRIRDELQSVIVFAVERGMVPLYVVPNLFGEPAAAAFPGAILDIEEAGKCLALDRPTACVFHLMRVLELALQVFGAKLGIADTSEKNWQIIVNNINGALKKLPQTTREEKEYLGECSEAVAHLQHVKDAWRNDVMHPRESYTMEQAVDIWNHTRPLMMKLADIVQ